MTDNLKLKCKNCQATGKGPVLCDTPSKAISVLFKTCPNCVGNDDCDKYPKYQDVMGWPLEHAVLYQWPLQDLKVTMTQNNDVKR